MAKEVLQLDWVPFKDVTAGQAAPLIRRLTSPLWTGDKAKLIERYLYYFVLVTKHGTYIDCFGGPQSPKHPDTWAAKLVLESKPRWLRDFILGDKDNKQAQALRDLCSGLESRRKNEPKRTIRVLEGDFNEIVESALSGVNEKQAAFCLLDQRTFECRWESVRKVAQRKKIGHKIEIFYFLPVGWLARAASGLKRNTNVLKEWWGRSDWQQLPSMKVTDLAVLTRDRFAVELGYQYVVPWPIYERKGGGRTMYYMIHASDHPLAQGLMRRAYSKALDQPEPPEQFKIEFFGEEA